MIWCWTGEEAKRKLPYVPELEDQEYDWSHGTPFIKECHPNVMMINAIDAHHFTSVHHLPVNLFLRPKVINENTILFNNETRVPETSLLTRLIGKFLLWSSDLFSLLFQCNNRNSDYRARLSSLSYYVCHSTDS